MRRFVVVLAFVVMFVFTLNSVSARSLEKPIVIRGTNIEILRVCARKVIITTTVEEIENGRRTVTTTRTEYDDNGNVISVRVTRMVFEEMIK